MMLMESHFLPNYATNSAVVYNPLYPITAKRSNDRSFKFTSPSLLSLIGCFLPALTLHIPVWLDSVYVMPQGAQDRYLYFCYLQLFEKVWTENPFSLNVTVVYIKMVICTDFERDLANLNENTPCSKVKIDITLWSILSYWDL
jgi:hypothetical protein